MSKDRRRPPAAATPPSAAETFARPVYCLLGLPFDAVDLAAAVRRVRRAAACHQPCVLATPNLNFLIACRSDPAFRDSVIASDLSLADGMPIVWLARLLGIPLPARVAGAGLFEALQRGECRRKDDDRLGVYFFGGPAGAAELARQRLNASGGELVCVGCDCPGFGAVETMSGRARLERINASSADFLVVALGARKGQAWIERNRARLTVPVIGHLGAVVNFVAGTVARAPVWMQRTGLEWLWRIKEEPALWRRYWSDGLALLGLFFTRVLPQVWVSRRRPPSAAALAAARIETFTTANLASVQLAGAWGEANLRALRERLDDAFLAGRDVYVDMFGVSRVDSAFLGLLMLLYGYQRRQGRQLRIGPVQPAVRRSFRYSGAGFLLAARPRPAVAAAAAAGGETVN